MPADHLDNIQITILLDPAPTPARGFGVPLLIVDSATSSLDGDRTRRYSTFAAVQADNTAGFVSASVLEATRVAFAQTPPPAEIMLGRRVGPETYAAALTAIIADDPDFYGIAIEPRTDAEILSVSGAVEALVPGRLFVAQSDDSDWLTAGLPAGLTALDERERTAVVFHTTDAEWADFGWLAGRLAFDPDVTSTPWDAQVKEVADLTPFPTDTEKGNLDDNNANHGLPFGGVQFWMDPGVSQNTRPLYEQLTADWFEARLQERIADLKAAYSARGEKLVLDEGGQAVVLAEILAQYNDGEAAGHFVTGQTLAQAEPLTDADRTAQRMRFTGQAQIAVSGRIFVFTFNFGRDPVAT